MECSLFLDSVELAVNTFIGGVDGIHHSLEIALSVHPVVEELITQAELFKIGVDVPCTTDRLVQNAITAIVQSGLTLTLHRVRLGNGCFLLEQSALNLPLLQSWIGRAEHEAALLCVGSDLVYADVEQSISRADNFLKGAAV